MAIQTGDNKFSVCKWIVDPTAGLGTHTTIASAITSAGTGDIFIRPGTYTEDFTIPPGINLIGFKGDGNIPTVTIIGKITMSAAGTASIENVRLQTNSDFSVVVSGAAASILYINNCDLNCTNNTGISFTSSDAGSRIFCNNCTGDQGALLVKLFTKSSAGNLHFNYCRFTNTGTSVTASDWTAGNVYTRYVDWHTPVANSGTPGGNFFYTFWDTGSLNVVPFSQQSTAPDGCQLNHCFISNSANAVIDIGAGAEVKVYNTTIDCGQANTITGAGIATVSNLSFKGSGTGIGATTVTYQSTGDRVNIGGVHWMAGSGSPNGSVTAPKGSYYMNTAGSGVADRAYVNTDGGTTWTNITTAA